MDQSNNTEMHQTLVGAYNYNLGLTPSFLLKQLFYSISNAGDIANAEGYSTVAI